MPVSTGLARAKAKHLHKGNRSTFVADGISTEPLWSLRIDRVGALMCRVKSVSYTHLTLPTIYSV